MTIQISKYAKQVGQLLLKVNALTFKFNPPFTYTSGLKSPIYLDNRLVMSYPEIRNKIIDHYVGVIKDKIGLGYVNWISATATAAIPHGSWVADRLNLPLVYVRPSTKSYGKAGKLEGYLKKGSAVVIIEDHISTAESVVDNAKTIRTLGGKVDFCVATSTYETKKSIDTLKKNKISLIALTTGKIIVEQAFKMGKITKDEKVKVDLWFTDSPAWVNKIF